MRSNLVHSLISVLGLLSPNNESSRVQVVKPVPASKKDLMAYHTEEYLDHVLDPSNAVSMDEDTSSSSFGLEDDCPPFKALHAYVPLVGGASLTAADILKKDAAEVAICWDGGRHHAQKSHASGFCYVADCVLAILSLKRPIPSSVIRRPKIMYLDLDLHFSDAVSQAFSTPNSSLTPQVLTCSVHYAAPGFFPVSELSSLPTSSSSDPFTLSIPLKAGASNKTFKRIWPLIEGARKAFDPDYVVVQCGVDGLADDPFATWNWSLGADPGSKSEGAEEGSLGWCIEQVLSWPGKKLLLGGGGYNSTNAARAWAYLTSIALGKPLSLETEIPDHAAFPLYAPSFTLDVPPGNMQDLNTDEYLLTVEGAIGTMVGKIAEVMSQ